MSKNSKNKYIAFGLGMVVATTIFISLEKIANRTFDDGFQNGRKHGLIYGKSEGYKQGQINAINGKIDFELIEQPDKSKTWEPIKNAEETNP